jgi:hypothetical protein
VIVASASIIVRRGRGAGEAQRRALAPVLWTGGVAFSVFVLAKGSTPPARLRTS